MSVSLFSVPTALGSGTVTDVPHLLILLTPGVTAAAAAVVLLQLHLPYFPRWPRCPWRCCRLPCAPGCCHQQQHAAAVLHHRHTAEEVSYQNAALAALVSTNYSLGPDKGMRQKGRAAAGMQHAVLARSAKLT